MENPDLDSPGISGLFQPPVVLASLVAAGATACAFLPTKSVAALIHGISGLTCSSTSLKIAGGIVGAVSVAFFILGQVEMRQHG